MIDADNVSQKYIKYILDEIANHGIPTYKRIYGDWTKPQLGSWKETLLEYSITPIQQYGYTTGKNATDSALIIDAMDILYSENVDGFCIVSSDSDFTRLAARLSPFIVACEKFKYLETLYTSAPEEKYNGRIPAKREYRSKVQEDLAELVQAIRTIVTEVSDEDGWAFLGDVGNMLSKRYPDFDTRNYGYSKLTPLVESLGCFEIISRRTTNSHITHNFIKNK